MPISFIPDKRGSSVLVKCLRLERYSNLPSLYYRRARGDIIETFKHMTGTYAVDASYLKLDNGKTRGHRYKMKKDRFRKPVR